MLKMISIGQNLQVQHKLGPECPGEQLFQLSVPDGDHATIISEGFAAFWQRSGDSGSLVKEPRNSQQGQDSENANVKLEPQAFEVAIIPAVQQQRVAIENVESGDDYPVGHIRNKNEAAQAVVLPLQIDANRYIGGKSIAQNSHLTLDAGSAVSLFDDLLLDDAVTNEPMLERSIVRANPAAPLPTASPALAVTPLSAVVDGGGWKDRLPPTELSANIVASTNEHMRVERSEGMLTGTGNATTPNLTDSVRQQIVATIAARRDETKIEIALDPPELGKISIEFEGRGHGLQRVFVSAETIATADLIKRSIEMLQQELYGGGLGGLNIGLRDFKSDDQKRNELDSGAGPLADPPIEPGTITFQITSDGRLDLRR